MRGSVTAGGTADKSGRTGTAPTLACTLPIPWSVGSTHCLNPGGALAMVTEVIRPSSHILGGNMLYLFPLSKPSVLWMHGEAGKLSEGLIQQSMSQPFKWKQSRQQNQVTPRAA